MSKEEGSMYRRKLHIPIVLGRMSTSQTVLKRSNSNLDLDRAFGVSDASSGTTVAEVPIPPQSGANH